MTAIGDRPHRLGAVLREGSRITPLELFFDLVFVLALTQCTALMADDPTWEGLARGESIVAIGVGAGHDLTTGIVIAACLGIAVAAAMWWLYFDVVALVAERRLSNVAPGRERNTIARDSFSYLHFPMVAGIVLAALGLKKTLEHVDELVAAAVLVALLPAAIELDALLTLAIAAALLAALSATRPGGSPSCATVCATSSPTSSAADVRPRKLRDRRWEREESTCADGDRPQSDGGKRSRPFERRAGQRHGRPFHRAFAPVCRY